MRRSPSSVSQSPHALALEDPRGDVLADVLGTSLLRNAMYRRIECGAPWGMEVPALAPGNVDKSMAAPVTAILAYDVAWYEQLGRLTPSRPESRERFAAMPAAERDRLADLNALLQAGYLILAARAVGLDCGPMGGFDRAKVDAAFFPDGAWRSLLLVNLGHGDPTRLFPRQPRLDFDDVCRLA